MHTLLEIRGAFQLPVGMVILESAVRDIVLELPFVHKLPLLIFFPHALFLSVLIRHVGLSLRENHHRQRETQYQQNYYSFHYLFVCFGIRV